MTLHRKSNPYHLRVVKHGEPDDFALELQQLKDQKRRLVYEAFVTLGIYTSVFVAGVAFILFLSGH